MFCRRFMTVRKWTVDGCVHSIRSKMGNGRVFSKMMVSFCEKQVSIYVFCIYCNSNLHEQKAKHLTNRMVFIITFYTMICYSNVLYTCFYNILCYYLYSGAILYHFWIDHINIRI